MTSGSVTVLVDRLEAAGLIERSREHADRRRVTLRPTPAAQERARAFTETSVTEIAAALRGADPSDLATSTVFLGRMVEAATAAADRLRAGRPPGVGR
jgi:DNA-binding MarR family transcriptional regulator